MSRKTDKITRRGGTRFAIETIQAALVRANGNQTKAAQMLGLSSSAISVMKSRSTALKEAIDGALHVAMIERIKKAEGVVDYHLRKKNLDAAKFVLTKTVVARDTGWFARPDSADEETGGAITNVVFNFPAAAKKEKK